MTEPPKQPLPPVLEGWLRIATRGLCEAAVKRIQSEVSSHYREAVEAYRSQGMPEEEAQRRAGECLGDPNAARRGFQRTYLVKWQERLLSSMATVSENRIGFALGFLGVNGLLFGSAAVVSPFFAVGMPRATAMACVFLCLFIIVRIPYWRERRRARREGRRAPEGVFACLFESRPKTTTATAIALCLPYWFFVAEYGIWSLPLLWFVLLPFIVWYPALKCAWKKLFEETWRWNWLRDLLTAALGGALAWGSFAMLQHALEAANPFTRHGISLEVNPLYPGNVVFWAFIASLLLGASLLTFLGAWLARKRGNGPSQATPEPVRDDAI